MRTVHALILATLALGVPTTAEADYACRTWQIDLLMARLNQYNVTWTSRVDDEMQNGEAGNVARCAWIERTLKFGDELIDMSEDCRALDLRKVLVANRDRDRIFQSREC